MSSLCEEGEEKVGGGEQVGREVSRKQRELCKLLFDTRSIRCFTLLSLVKGKVGENLLTGVTGAALNLKTFRSKVLMVEPLLPASSR